jgi:uncharacterized RDD family membrane protein YckC
MAAVAGKSAKAPQGFLSLEALKHLRRVAIVAGASPIILFFLAYAGIFLAAFAGGSASDRLNKAYSYSVASQGQDTYYVTGSDLKESDLHLRSDKASGAPSLSDFKGKLEETFLLSDPALRRVWVLSDQHWGYWDGNQMVWIDGAKGWEGMERPFLWQGKPAFLDSKEGALAVWQLGDKGWTRARSVTLKGFDKEDLGQCLCGKLRLTRWHDTWQWFYRHNHQLRYFQGEPTGQAMDVNHWPAFDQASDGNWVSKGLSSGLYIADHDLSDTVRVWQKKDEAWTQLPMNRAKAESLALLDGKDQEPLLALSDPGLLLASIRDPDKVPQVLRKPWEKPSRVLLWMMIPSVLLFLTIFFSPLAVAFFLSRASKSARPAKIRLARRSIQLASLLRRALARIVDSFIVLCSALALAALCAFPLGLFSDTKDNPIRIFEVMFITMGWGFLASVALIIYEGNTGISPGRSAAGIRLLGVDLKPCGPGRSFLRALLTVVDGQFFWVPGLLIAALSAQQQRLGDMAADTVVIKE